MQPVVDRFRNSYRDQITFLDLNARKEGRAAFNAGGFPGHPAYVILRPDGQEVWRSFGELEAADLESAIQQALE